MPPRPGPIPPRWILAGLGFGLTFYGAAQFVGHSESRYRGRYAFDALNYHEPTIRAFAETWPAADFTNYWSATTPLYHYILAGVAQIDGSRTTLMAVSGLFTLAMFALLAAACARRVGAALGIALMLPMATSLYVFTQSIWLLPDNAGWLGVLVMLILALRRRFDAFTLFAGGLTLILLVMTRQIHAWTGGLLVASAWLGSESQTPRTIAGLFTDLRARITRTLGALLAVAPAATVTLAFIALWGGGLVVPRYQEKYHGLNLATPGFFLMLTGIAAVFYTGAILPALINAWRRHRALLIFAILAAIALAVYPETTYNDEAGRKSGLWNLVRVLPILGGHTSVVVLGMAPIGAAALVALTTGVRRRAGWILAAAAVGSVTAQTMSPELWQRYHEPLILMIVMLGSAELISARRARFGGTRDPGGVALLTMAGPITLAVLYASLTVVTITKNSFPVVPAFDGAYHLSHEAEPIPNAPRGSLLPPAP